VPYPELAPELWSADVWPPQELERSLEEFEQVPVVSGLELVLELERNLEA
jgi:hypothetical protein